MAVLVGVLPASYGIKPGNADIIELERFVRPAPSDLRDLKALDVVPVVLAQVTPEFPEHLRAATVAAEVLVGFIVDTKGEVSEAYAIRSNNPWFERTSVETVRKWRFKPGMVQGRAVNTRMQVPIMFSTQPEGKVAWSLQVLSDSSKLPARLRYDEPPSVRATTFGVYPFDALQEGHGEKVRMRALIDTGGRVAQTAFEGEPDTRIAGAVRAMMDHWRFKPASLKGNPVSTIVFLELTFAEKGESCAPLSASARSILKELGRGTPRIRALADLDAVPRLIAHHLPVHPPALVAEGVEGRALIEFFIDEQGNVQLPRIVEATHPEFGYAAAQAVATWWFEPPLKDGKPVTVRTRVPVMFEMKNGAEK